MDNYIVIDGHKDDTTHLQILMIIKEVNELYVKYKPLGGLAFDKAGNPYQTMIKREILSYG